MQDTNSSHLTSISGEGSPAALLPCPFCGGAMQFRKALWVSDGCTDGIIHDEPTKCGMVVFDTDSTDESVITAWNRRTTRETL
jgi:hypothetical protein